MATLRTITSAIVVSLGATLALPVGAELVDARLPLRIGEAHGEKSIQSWQALREQHVVMQQFDYSCGAAALATLLQYYFNDPVDEATVLDGLMATLSAEEIAEREANGFSLLDLKNFALGRAYQAVGVKLDYAALPALRGPVLIHLNRDGYQHFAVLKGISGDRVFLADPSRGNTRLPLEQFADEWTGVALVLGKAHFGVPGDHALALPTLPPLHDEMLAAQRAMVTPR